MKGDRWLTVADAAERVSRSRRTVDRWVREGLLRSGGGRVREKDLLFVERRVRQRRTVQHKTREIEVVVGAHAVGKLRYNPETGRVVGELEPALTVTEMSAITRR